MNSESTEPIVAAQAEESVDPEKVRADAAEAKLAKVLDILSAAYNQSLKDTFNGGPNALRQGAAVALAFLRGEIP